MLTINDLKKMTCKELLKVAKERNLKGRSSMSKAVLVCALSLQLKEEEAEANAAVLQEALQEDQDALEEQRKRKEIYIKRLIGGELIAFRVGGWQNRVLSGKVIAVGETSCRVETRNGLRFLVRKENIIWVKTGDRWPKGVYQALKELNARMLLNE